MFSLFFKPEQHVLDKIKQLNKIEHINNGGCVLAALAIYNILISNYKDKKPKIIFSDSRDTKAQNKRLLRENIPFNATHVVVKLGIYYYDSTGTYTKSELKDIWGSNTLIEVPYKLAYKAALDRRLWNTDFPRKQGIAEINKVQEIFIK